MEHPPQDNPLHPAFVRISCKFFRSPTDSPIENKGGCSYCIVDLLSACESVALKG